jgi:hypothetical protein
MDCEAMTDREFIAEVRRGLICIMRAVMRKYGLGWLDFLPKEVAAFKDLPLAIDVTERMA